MENQPQTRSNRRRGEPELEELEEEVKEMTQKLRHYRSTLPSQFSDTAASILAAQRPLLGFLDLDLAPGSNEHRKSGFHADGNEGIPGTPGPATAGGVSAAEDGEITDKLHELTEKISRNVLAIPILLKRLQECISRIDKLGHPDEIHPVFKRKKC
ncbi:hypothetical protein AKJ16_DCAP03703 [Drosera capensis]